MISKPGRTHEASRAVQDMEECYSFPMGSVDSAVCENSQSRESRLLAPVEEIRSRGFQLVDEQPIVHSQRQPGEQFQVGEHLARLLSITTSQSSTVVRHIYAIATGQEGS